MSNLDNLLDLTLDDLADLPEFKPFSAGVHQVLATMDTKEVGGKPCVELSFKLIETAEKANPQDPDSNAGDTASTLFMLDNEFGLGNLKNCATPIAVALGCSSIRDVVEQCKDVECLIVTSIRVDKNDPDKKYMQVKELNVV